MGHGEIGNAAGLGERVIGILCVLASAVGFFFSLNHGGIWPLAWVAPIPVLWFAFGTANRWVAFVAAWAAYALGSTNVLIAYAGEMPPFVLVLATCAPALYFGLTTTLARFVTARLGSIGGAVAFGAVWTTCDWLVSFLHDGTAPSPAYSQVGAPVMIQSASVFGLWVVTFLLGFVPAGIVLGLRRRTAIPAFAAVVLFALNVGYGEWRLAQTDQAGAVRIGVGSDDSLSLKATVGHPVRVAEATTRYGAAAQMLARGGASLIVFPEKIARLSAADRRRRAHLARGRKKSTRNDRHRLR